jgi:hypothetical protein
LPAVVQAAAEPDPIFAAIERYKSAVDTFNDFEGSESSPQHYALEHAFHQAQDALLEAVPTTLAGMKAKISFCMNDETFSASELPHELLHDFLNTLYKSACMMARVS